MAKHSYEVVVGNIGTVYSGPSKLFAKSKYQGYVGQSTSLPGSRAYGESVTLLCDGEIVLEHTGTLQADDEDNELDLDSPLEDIADDESRAYGPSGAPKGWDYV